MATTEHFYTGNGSTTTFAFTFPYLSNADVEIELNNVLKTENTSGQTDNDYTISNTNIVFNSAPGNGVAIHIYRATNVDSAQAFYASGSSIRAADLNNNHTQLLYSAQEASQSITTSDIQDSAVTSAKILDGTIATADIADDAVTADKLANSINTEIAANTAKVTNATHTGDVTGATSLTIAQDAVTTSKIAADAIVSAKIADNAINSEHYTNGSIDTEHIADDAVTDAKLANSINTAIAANTAKNTNVSTNLSTSTTTTAVTVASSDGTNATIGEATGSAAGVMSSAHHDKLDGIETGATADQTNAEIRAAVEAATDSNVFTDADHSKLNAIEASATADQTDAEIRAAVEAASDSNVFTDADHSKLNAIEASATADQTSGEIKTLLQSDKLTSSEIATGALDGRYYTETELDAGQLDNRYYTKTESESRYYNLASGEEIQSGETWSAADNKIATTAAIDARIIDLVDDVGGFVPIANETSFPNANPDVNNGPGTIVSIGSLSSNLTSNGSGVISISNGTVGNSTVTITGAENSTTYSAGYGLLVETTTTLNTYTFHRLSSKATEVTTVSGSISSVNTVAGAISNVNSVANDATDIGTVAGISGNVTTVAGVASNVTTVAGISSDVTAVANDATDIGVVAGKATEIGRLGTADAVADMNTLGTTAIVSDMDTLADISSNITTVANNSSNVTTVAGISGNVTTVAGANSNITTVAGANSNISTVAGSISNVNTTATNIANVNNFSNTYQIASSNPSTDGGGNSLAAGDLYFNTSANELKVYNGSAWQGGVTATGNLAGLGANTFTGNQTIGGILEINSAFPKIKLTDSDHNSDYTIQNANGDWRILDETNNVTRFTIAANGTGNFAGNLDVGAGLDVTGNITVSGTVDGVDIASLNSTVSGITTNATHSGEVTGSGALTIADNVVDEANLKVSNSPTNGYFLSAQSGNTGGLTWAAVPSPDLTSVSSNLIADSNDTRSLGTSSNSWKKLYISDSIFFKGANSSNSLIVCVGDLFALQNSNSNGYIDIRNHNNHGLRLNSDAHLIPHADSVIDLGLTGTRFRAAYVDTYYGDGSNLTGIAAGVSSDSDDNTVGGSGAGDSITAGSGVFNTCFGKDAGTGITSGDYNTAIGGQAYKLGNGRLNVFIGYNAGSNGNASGDGNAVVGNTAAYSLTSGANNAILGYMAAEFITSASNSTLVGMKAGHRITSGSYNTAVGHEALKLNTTGEYNTATGRMSLGSCTTGTENTGFGNYALGNVTTSDYNTSIGSGAGMSVTSGANNTLLGCYAGYGSGAIQLQTGSNNICVGYQAATTTTSVSNEVTIGNSSITKFRIPGINVTLKDNGGTPTNGHVLTVDSNGEAGFAAASGGATEVNGLSDAKTANSGEVLGIGTGALAADNGSNLQLAIGKNALNDVSTGASNVAVGNEALSKIASSDKNNALGVWAGQYLTGTSNVAIGYSSLQGVDGSTTGNRNVAIGERTGEDITTADDNVLIGHDAGRDLTTGDFNIAIGLEAGYDIKDHSKNTLIGYKAGYNIDSDENIYIGHYSGYGSGSGMLTGSKNVCLGPYTGYYITTGTENVCLGNRAGIHITEGSNNVIIGDGAGNSGTNNLTTGQNNILIGYQAAASSATVSHEITLGNTSTSTKLRVPGRGFEVKAGAVTQGGVFYENNTTVSADYTITDGRNAMAAGPITIASGVTVTVGANETLTIV